MTEILWLGRGGQGAFTAAKLLGASFASKGEGAYSLAFPSFGPERRGAPVRAFTKLDTSPILDRSETERADFIILLDETLYTPSLRALLKDGGKILVNTKTAQDRIIPFDADGIAYTYGTWNAQDSAEEQDAAVEALTAQGQNANMVRFETGSVFKEGESGQEHMASFNYGYKLTAVRDWIFQQSK